MERIYRDVRVCEFYEETWDLYKAINQLALGQGLRCTFALTAAQQARLLESFEIALCHSLT